MSKSPAIAAVLGLLTAATMNLAGRVHDPLKAFGALEAARIAAQAGPAASARTFAAR